MVCSTSATIYCETSRMYITSIVTSCMINFSLVCLCIIIFSLSVLSIVPHQEPRFLMPLLLPFIFIPLPALVSPGKYYLVSIFYYASIYSTCRKFISQLISSSHLFLDAFTKVVQFHRLHIQMEHSYPNKRKLQFTFIKCTCRQIF